MYNDVNQIIKKKKKKKKENAPVRKDEDAENEVVVTVAP